MYEQELCVDTSSHQNSQPPQSPRINPGTKSDINLWPTSPHLEVRSFRSCTKEYYKNYEHDTVPVKDSDKNCSILQGGSLTNAGLDDLEKRTCTDVSPELQTDESSSVSLDSNIKLIKLTVEKIFENFFTNMSDFEHYKKRFNDIIAQSKGGYTEDMEEFINDMFEHIQSSDHSMPSVSGTPATAADPDSCASSGGDTLSNVQQQGKVIEETYQNENYLTDFSLDDSGPKLKTSNRNEILNILMLGDTPCVEIKLNGRNLLSEILINANKHAATAPSVSADNLKRLAAKRLESEKCMGTHNCTPDDRDIPIKNSCAKKNLHLNEDFANKAENDSTPKSFLCKICNVLCKKFRRNIIG